MLYHVPDLPRALSEIQRVLKPGGRLYATTVGREHMQEMDRLVKQALPDISWQSMGQRLPFLLENGHELLAPFFSPVALFTYEDALEVTESEALIAYVRSVPSGSRLREDQVDRLRATIQRELAAYGTIHITNASGMFAATKIRHGS
jgi:SAM-dependent methyltransferase